MSRPMPFDLLKKFKVLKWGGDDSEAGVIDEREEVASLNDADVVSSEYLKIPGFHTLALDIDVPAALIPSSTPGHSHLFINTQMSWDQYEAVLDALAVAGILEPGYVGASKARKATAVRLPWVSKPVDPFAFLEAF